MLIGGISAQAREIWERDWVEARTENVFVSAISEKRTLRFAPRFIVDVLAACKVSATVAPRARGLGIIGRAGALEICREGRT